MADKYFAHGDYSSAAKYYEQAVAGPKATSLAHAPYQLQKESNEATVVVSSEVLYRLAESHRLLYRHAEAARWYGKVLAQKPSELPLAGLYYSESLLACGMYEDAEKALHTFLDNYKRKDAYRTRAEKTLANLAFRKGLKPDESILLTKTVLGDTGADYAATWAASDMLLFTSTRSVDGTIHRNALYTGNEKQGVTRLPLTVSQPDFGAATMSADGKRLYFMATATTDKTGKRYSTIYISEKTDSAWTIPTALNTMVNVAGSNARQPFVSKDGKWLFYASDRPGGKGGFDIWYAPLDEKGYPGKSINAGAAINTKGNEEAPFYHTASATLVFASDSHPGMGGYDLFAAAGQVGSWAAPVNMGMPVNSVKDDLYFVSRGQELLEQAMLSSDRASDCCLQTFALGKLPPVAAAKKEDTAIVTPAATQPPVAVTPVVPAVFDSSNTFVTNDILFDFDNAVIKPASFPMLDGIGGYLQAHPAARLEVGAHTDSKGAAAYNLRLSEKRAAACVGYLVKKGIAANRLVAKGFGECCPLEKETDATGVKLEAAREKNRRVVLKLLEQAD